DHVEVRPAGGVGVQARQLHRLPPLGSDLAAARPLVGLIQCYRARSSPIISTRLTIASACPERPPASVSSSPATAPPAFASSHLRPFHTAAPSRTATNAAGELPGSSGGPEKNREQATPPP